MRLCRPLLFNVLSPHLRIPSTYALIKGMTIPQDIRLWLSMGMWGISDESVKRNSMSLATKSILLGDGL